jgi:hypothetical protein
VCAASRRRLAPTIAFSAPAAQPAARRKPAPEFSYRRRPPCRRLPRSPLALGRLHLEGRGSEAAVATSFGAVIEIVDGLAVRQQFWTDQSKALEAAGLSEPGSPRGQLSAMTSPAQARACAHRAVHERRSRSSKDPVVRAKLARRHCPRPGRMGAARVIGGLNPLARERLVHDGTCRYVLAVMTTAGLYETSGDWSCRSRVSGGRDRRLDRDRRPRVKACSQPSLHLTGPETACVASSLPDSSRLHPGWTSALTGAQITERTLV